MAPRHLAQVEQLCRICLLPRCEISRPAGPTGRSRAALEQVDDSCVCYGPLGYNRQARWLAACPYLASPRRCAAVDRRRSEKVQDRRDRGFSRYQVNRSALGVPHIARMGSWRTAWPRMLRMRPGRVAHSLKNREISPGTRAPDERAGSRMPKSCIRRDHTAGAGRWSECVCRWDPRDPTNGLPGQARADWHLSSSGTRESGGRVAFAQVMKTNVV